MMFCARQFNTFLLLAVAAGALCGCATGGGQHKKQLSSLRIHLEVDADTANGQAATIGRTSPVTIHVEPEPFLTEAHVKEAKVVDNEGGFALQVKFGRQGGQLLEQYTTANRGKHMAI